MTSEKFLKVQIRWLIRRDLFDVLDIDKQCFDVCWDSDEYVNTLRQRNMVGMVAEIPGTDTIVGAMVYQLSKEKITIVRMFVHPDYRHRGVGSQMVRRMMDKLSQQRRQKLEFDVDEENLDGQLFLKNQGFFATHIIEEEEQNLYHFERYYVADEVELIEN